MTLPSSLKSTKDHLIEEQSRLIQIKEMVNHETKEALMINRQLVLDLRSRNRELFQENQNLLQAIRLKGGLNGYTPRAGGLNTPVEEEEPPLTEEDMKKALHHWKNIKSNQGAGPSKRSRN